MTRSRSSDPTPRSCAGSPFIGDPVSVETSGPPPFRGLDDLERVQTRPENPRRSERAPGRLELNKETWNQFLTSHRGLVRMVARDHPIRGWSPQDLEQEVWRVLIDRLSQLRFDAHYTSLRGWVLTVAHHTLVNLARSEARRLRAEHHEQLRWNGRGSREEGTPQDQLQRRESIARVLRTLGQLRERVPDRSYRIFELKYLEGRSAASIAAELNLSQTRVLVLANRTFEKFLSLMTQEVLPR